MFCFGITTTLLLRLVDAEAELSDTTETPSELDVLDETLTLEPIAVLLVSFVVLTGSEFFFISLPKLIGGYKSFLGWVSRFSRTFVVKDPMFWLIPELTEEKFWFFCKFWFEFSYFWVTCSF